MANNSIPSYSEWVLNNIPQPELPVYEGEEVVVQAQPTPSTLASQVDIAAQQAQFNADKIEAAKKDIENKQQQLANQQNRKDTTLAVMGALTAGGHRQDMPGISNSAYNSGTPVSDAPHIYRPQPRGNGSAVLNAIGQVMNNQNKSSGNSSSAPASDEPNTNNGEQKKRGGLLGGLLGGK